MDELQAETIKQRLEARLATQRQQQVPEAVRQAVDCQCKNPMIVQGMWQARVAEEKRRALQLAAEQLKQASSSDPLWLANESGLLIRSNAGQLQRYLHSTEK